MTDHKLLLLKMEVLPDSRDNQRCFNRIQVDKKKRTDINWLRAF
jgi:hypothetical protein